MSAGEPLCPSLSANGEANHSRSRYSQANRGGETGVELESVAAVARAPVQPEPVKTREDDDQHANHKPVVKQYTQARVSSTGWNRFSDDEPLDEDWAKEHDNDNDKSLSLQDDTNRKTTANRNTNATNGKSSVRFQDSLSGGGGGEAVPVLD